MVESHCCVSLPLFFATEQGFSTTPGPTRHNIYSSQAANAAPLLLSQFKHSISLTSLGSCANTHSRVDSKGFSWVVWCCLKVSVSVVSVTTCCCVRRGSFLFPCCYNEANKWSKRVRGEWQGGCCYTQELLCSIGLVSDNERHIAHSYNMC